MKDSVILGSGNSRYLKSVADFKTLYPTYDDFAAALVAGTLPIDFNGINPAGFQQLGDALGKATLLKDATAQKHGRDASALPDDMWVDLVPVGGILWYAKDGIPDGYLKCDGSVVSRTDYASLFAVIGTAFGTGDGRTTFALPDLRAKFIRGAGTSNGYSATFGQTETATSIRNIVAQSGAFSISGSDKIDNASKSNQLSTSVSGTSQSYYYHHVHPYNIALTPIIKY